jgi:hypothetical protein
MSTPFCPTHQVRMIEVGDTEARERGVLYECPEGGYECYERGKRHSERNIPPLPASPARNDSATQTETGTPTSKTSSGGKFRKVRTKNGFVMVGPRPPEPYPHY